MRGSVFRHLAAAELLECSRQCRARARAFHILRRYRHHHKALVRHGGKHGAALLRHRKPCFGAYGSVRSGDDLRANVEEMFKPGKNVAALT
jgi:hypothetical protein